MKISSLLIAMVFIGACMAVTMLYLGSVVEEYAPGTYDTNTLAVYNRTRDIENITQKINQSIYRISVADSNPEMIGSFFSAGYEVIKGTISSSAAMVGIITGALQSIPGASIMMYAIVSIAILAFLFIIVSTILNRDV